MHPGLQSAGAEVDDTWVLVARGWLVLLAVVTLLAGGMAVWLVVQPPLVKRVQYATGAAMAERIGCRDTYRTVPTGSARSAGECTTGNGVRVRLRVYADRQGAQGWVDGVSGVDGLDPDVGASATGDGWAVVLTGGPGPNARSSLISVLERN